MDIPARHQNAVCELLVVTCCWLRGQLAGSAEPRGFGRARAWFRTLSGEPYHGRVSTKQRQGRRSAERGINKSTRASQMVVGRSFGGFTDGAKTDVLSLLRTGMTILLVCSCEDYLRWADERWWTDGPASGARISYPVSRLHWLAVNWNITRKTPDCPNMLAVDESSRPLTGDS